MVRATLDPVMVEPMTAGSYCGGVKRRKKTYETVSEDPEDEKEALGFENKDFLLSDIGLSEVSEDGEDG